MGFNAVKVFQSWSYTRLCDYERCPAFANYKHLLKWPEPKSPAMQRGADIADATDAWFKGARRLMPPELKPLAGEYKALKKNATVETEAYWGFTKDWEPCEPTDWNRCWLRMKIDILTTAERVKVLNLYDSKTGKYNDRNAVQYLDQLKLYASGGVVQFPTVRDINVRLLFSDIGIQHPRTGPQQFTKAEALKEQGAWNKRVKPMFADKKFTPRPGPYCSWCPFSKNFVFKEKDDKGNVIKETKLPGPCKF